MTSDRRRRRPLELGEVDPDGLLRRYLPASRLAGAVATSPRSTLASCARMIRGDASYTFGLEDWSSTRFLEAVDAVRRVCGGDPGGRDDPDGPGWIEPSRTLAGIARHREVLARVVDGGGARVLLATGHPTGLLPHYQAIGRLLQEGGSQLLAPLDDRRDVDADGRRLGLRYLDGVACLFDGGALLHTHRSRWMERALDALDALRGGPGTVELCVADHGFAGAAIERGIPTLSIAEVNDPALPLAQVRGRTDAVLPIDDNLAPQRFVPVTAAMLAR